jgi:IS30 family transposase
MEKLNTGKNAKELTKVVTRLLTAYINHVHTITGDNGTEFADHQSMAKILKTKFFFTHPYSAWEKGLIENTNKLVRQCFDMLSNRIYLKKQILTQLINNKSKKYNIKSIIDQGKN